MFYVMKQYISNAKTLSFKYKNEFQIHNKTCFITMKPGNTIYKTVGG